MVKLLLTRYKKMSICEEPRYVGAVYGQISTTFSSQRCKICKLSFYQNSSTDSKHIWHNDKHPQVFVSI